MDIYHIIYDSNGKLEERKVHTLEDLNSSLISFHVLGVYVEEEDIPKETNKKNLRTFVSVLEKKIKDEEGKTEDKTSEKPLQKLLEEYNNSHLHNSHYYDPDFVDKRDRFQEKYSGLEVGLTNTEDCIRTWEQIQVNLAPERGGGLWVINISGENILVPKLGYLDGDWARRSFLKDMFELEGFKDIRSYTSWELKRPAKLIKDNPESYKVREKGKIIFN